jgi:hypothetical protein
MPYTIDWLIPNEVIYTHYRGVTTVEELRDCLTEMQHFMDSSPRHLVHAISDVGDIIEAVSLKDSLKVVREVGQHPRAGWTLSIREKSAVVKMGSAIGSSIFQLRFRAFDTLEDAIKHLKVFDETLSWDKLNEAILNVSES